MALGGLGGAAVATLGFPGLLATSVVLIVGILVRSLVVVLAVGVSGTVTLALWTIAIVRCEQTAGHACSVDGPLLALFAWAAVLSLLGFAATWALRRRPLCG